MSYYITWFEIAAFITSLAAWGTIRKSPYLRWFPLLLFVVVSLEVYETFLKSPKVYINALIYNIQVPIQHLLYLVILYFAMEKSAYRRSIGIASLVFIPWAVVTGLFFTEKGHFNVLAYSVGSILIIIGIVVKFYEMLQNPAGFNFLKAPFFYMLFAYLLFIVGTFPLFTMGNWMYYTKGYKDILRMLKNAMSILNYVLYITYTISFIWMIRRKVT